MSTVVTLPSGAKLEVSNSPFEVSRALFQSILEEAKGLHLDPEANVDVNLFKDIFCIGLSSKKIETCLSKCMERATYNDLKISKDTFEPVEAREDYLDVCVEVMKVNIMPFTKNLSAKYSAILSQMTSVQA